MRGGIPEKMRVTPSTDVPLMRSGELGWMDFGLAQLLREMTWHWWRPAGSKDHKSLGFLKDLSYNFNHQLGQIQELNNLTAPFQRIKGKVGSGHCDKIQWTVRRGEVEIKVCHTRKIRKIVSTTRAEKNESQINPNHTYASDHLHWNLKSKSLLQLCHLSQMSDTPLEKIPSISPELDLVNLPKMLCFPDCDHWNSAKSSQLLASPVSVWRTGGKVDDIK